LYSKAALNIPKTELTVGASRLNGNLKLQNIALRTSRNSKRINNTILKLKKLITSL
jgi:hypothetical protein